MKRILLTIIFTIIVLIGGLFIYTSSGAYDISQLIPHNKLTKTIISITTHSSINKRMKDIVMPADLKDTSRIIMGFKHYNEMCLICHSAPGQHPSEMVEGLYPKPPELYKYSKEDDAREFFWIIKYGIKMTSMPAFKPTHDDEKLWAITSFVTQKLGKMTPEEYNLWLKKYIGADKADIMNKNSR